MDSSRRDEPPEAGGRNRTPAGTPHAERTLAQICGQRVRLFAAVLLAVVAVTAVFSWRTPPVYEGKTTLLLETQKAGDKVALVTAQNPFQQAPDINNEIQMLRSRTLAEEVAHRAFSAEGGIARPRGEQDFQPTAWVLGHTRVRHLEGSRVVEIRGQAGSAEDAAQLANTCAEVYVDLAQERTRAEVSQVRKFLADQVEVVRERLHGSETTLLDFQQRTKTANLEEETKALVDRAASFEGSYNSQMADLIAHRERLRALKTQLASTEGALGEEIPSVTGSVINQLRAELADQISYREKFLAQGYDLHHAKMVELEQRIQEIRGRLSAAIEDLQKRGNVTGDPLTQMQTLVDQVLSEEVEVASLEARVASLKQVMEQYNSKLRDIPDKSFAMGQIAHSTEVDQKILQMLVQRYEEARIEEAGLTGTSQIIDRAVPPRRPLRPDHRLDLAFGLVLGVAMACLACLAAERMQRRVQDASEAGRLSGLSVIGRIPPIGRYDVVETAAQPRRALLRPMWIRRQIRSLVYSGGLVSGMGPCSPVVEAFRSLRVHLTKRAQETPGVILVTSPGAGDGKTMCACNLALVLASGGNRVLLIDADLRRPSVAARAKVPVKRGLPDLLAGRASLEEVIKVTSHACLHLLLTPGPAQNPHDLLISPRLPELLQHLRGRYDHVIIDAPPMLPVADTTILSMLADLTLLVVRAGHSDCEGVVRAARALRTLGVPQPSLLVNDDRGAVLGRGAYGYYRKPIQLHVPPQRLLAQVPAAGPDEAERKVS
jgi:capsular exopolysaccharide synthesis family protein